MKRDDLIHPYISGNKFRKLQYALKDFKARDVKNVLTFGGAYSNHIHAFSFAAKKEGFQAIGIIRGDELADRPLNKTLQFAKEQGMRLKFVTRSEYKRRYDLDYLAELKIEFDCEVVPEGGTQPLAKPGLIDLVAEINGQIQGVTDICCASATGGTIAGIVSGLLDHQRAIGVLAVAGVEENIKAQIKQFTDKNNFMLETNAHWGGYAKTSKELYSFIKEFEKAHGILLDQVYTAKMVYRVLELIKGNFFKPGSCVCLVHTGGLQGLNLEELSRE